ncbi:hypothetical protein CDAR_614821 [Caerostris darwini]|uniref:Uncharacterized protein n=1 Tax=Caerostris darwini TaxID=1538125 RepID=A0AAV4U4Q2_9ARAC|nr:hypothetical protein CDAR_614821 [Caerostris darwini]
MPLETNSPFKISSEIFEAELISPVMLVRKETSKSEGSVDGDCNQHQNVEEELLQFRLVLQEVNPNLWDSLDIGCGTCKEFAR